MKSVVIIGSGNVAQHLIKALYKNSFYTIIQCFTRNRDSVSHLLDDALITNDYNLIKPADVYIISVSDAAVAQVSSALCFENKLVVHTSGSISINELDSKNRRGVLYPLQTFSKNKELNYNQIPFCIEAENNTDYLLLEKLAQSISSNVYSTTSQQRASLHIAAVFVSNFVNHLYEIGNQICTEKNVSFEILKPLIEETAQKIKTISPKEAQTGPAKRQDTIIINKHLQMLTQQNHKEIYKLLTQSIIDNEKKL